MNTTIEEPAQALVRPLLLSETASLAAADAARIATWIAYHSMMRAIDAQDPAFGDFASSDYRELRDAGSPPISHAVWIGSKQSMRSVDRTVALPWAVTPQTRRIYSSIFRLAAIHLVDVGPTQPVQHEGEALGFLVRVWPRPKSMSWPPTRQLSSDEVERMRRSA